MVQFLGCAQINPRLSPRLDEKRGSRQEVDHGPQELAYDMWWHLGYDGMVTSEDTAG
jgi:hypothetical protein